MYEFILCIVAGMLGSILAWILIQRRSVIACKIAAFLKQIVVWLEKRGALIVSCILILSSTALPENQNEVMRE